MDICTIKTEEITLRYFRFGNEHGQPFVIIPGVAIKSVMESAELIAGQYSLIAEEFDIYVLDRRDDMPDKYSVYDMADDTIKAMDTIGLHSAVIYGVSQGGMIAQVIATSRPDLVSRMVLCSTAPYIPDKSAQILNVWVENAEKNNISELMLSFAENVYSASYCEKNREAFSELSKMITKDDLRRFIITVKGGSGFDIREQLACIKCPLLVIAADMDKIFDIELSAEIIKRTNGELYIYKGQAHAVYDEEIDVLRRIKEFALRKMTN